MAVNAGTLKTYEVVGQREELADKIFNISPEETPIVSQMGREKTSAVKYDWQVDELAAPDTDNAVLEGDEASFTDPAPTVRLHNYVQISRKTAQISGTVEATDRAGRKSEMAFQMAKRSAEMKRDFEAIVTANQAANAGGAGVVRRTGSLLAFIKTNVDKAADGANPTYTDTPDDTRTDGTQRPFTESLLKNVISMCWTEGAQPRTVVVGAYNKQVASGFAGIATQTKNQSSAAPAKIIAAADVYVSDFGTLHIVPDRFSRSRDALVLDFEYLKLKFLRKFESTKLAKTGDSERRMIISEWGVKVGNEASQGLVADLATS